MVLVCATDSFPMAFMFVLVSYRLALEYGVFYALYIQKEQIAGPQNDHAARKAPGKDL
jgi:hypothetical protein